MSRFNIGAVSAVCALVGLTFSSASISDDAIIGYSDNPYTMAIAGTRAGGVIAGLKGEFVVSVAHVGNQIRKGRPVACKPVEVRIDMLYDAGNNNLGMRPGQRMELKPWNWVKESYKNASSNADKNTATDIVAFSVRTGQPSPGCSIVASGLFHPDGQDGSGAPIPFSVLPSTER